MPEIDEKIGRFKTDLRTVGAAVCVQRHIIFGHTHVLSEDQHFELKAEVAARFDVNPVEVFVVGSAKLGFSIVEKKRYRPFGDLSDIDLAIISPRLFDQLWDDVFEYYCRVRHWTGEQDFKNYLFRGWIRPDKLPPAHAFAAAAGWWEFFRMLSASGRYGRFKIAAGIYRSMKFMEKYQGICAQRCLDELTLDQTPNTEAQGQPT